MSTFKTKVKFNHEVVIDNKEIPVRVIAEVHFGQEGIYDTTTIHKSEILRKSDYEEISHLIDEEQLQAIDRDIVQLANDCGGIEV